MRFDNPKQIVADGYDAIGKRYDEWSGAGGKGERDRHLSILIEKLPSGAKVIDLGCGTGELATKRLAHKFDVTGVDISQKLIELARQNIPNAVFIHADIAALDFPENSFDAVTAFHSIIHMPRDEHAGLFKSIRGWLKPGGLFIASLSASGGEHGYEDNWLGAPMYWSGFDADTNKRLIEDAGMTIISATIQSDIEFDEPVSFLWIMAQKRGIFAMNGLTCIEKEVIAPTFDT
jgi:SAM-dependent methyltransferase